MDCLPRGEGVCTRRPLEMRLVHTPHVHTSNTQDNAWAKFDEIPGKKFTDFSEVTRQI